MIVRLLLFATAREAAGCSKDTFAVETDTDLTLAHFLDLAVERYGAAFAEVLAGSGVWLNGDEPQSGRSTPLRDGDEVAVLPPVSGGDGTPRSPAQAIPGCVVPLHKPFC
jgi:molybdopterin synthase sulfur carrier subunit